MARKINTIVVHCSASHQNVDAEDIKRWHLERGWRTIGYHYVITAEGEIQEGRPIAQMGAHVAGYNRDSIGICWVGGYKGVDNRTDAQKLALRNLITELVAEYDIDDNQIKGHCDFPNVSKTCPNFSVQQWYFNESN